MSTAQAQASAQLVRLMDGFVTTQLLYVAAKLGVADVLADGPQTARTIADEVGADPGQLGRMLRGLVLDEVLAEEEDGRFSLTPLGACLRDDVPGSVRGLAIARGDLYYRAAAGLPQTAVDGKAAFEHAYGEAFFDYLAGNPDDEATFQTSMAGRAEREAGDVVAAYDFGAFDTLVDVGGGVRPAGGDPDGPPDADAVRRRARALGGRVPQPPRPSRLSPRGHRPDPVADRPERDRGQDLLMTSHVAACNRLLDRRGAAPLA